MKEKAVITILGTAGVKVATDSKTNKKIAVGLQDNKANYKTKNGEKEYFNVFEHLIRTYGDEYDIVPFYTELSRQANELILQNTMPDLDTKPIFENGKKIEDEKDFDKIFAQIDEMISQNYHKIILDVSHGYRHLPILATVDALIQNFSNPDKIEKIIFAKEIDPFKLYEIIDLKEYLDLANIAFILTAFNDNYTITSHIKSKKYQSLINAMQDFSSDIMSLNLQHFYQNSLKNLIAELKQINDIAIKSQAKHLLAELEKLNKRDILDDYNKFYFLAKDLFEKGYILLSLALIFEGIKDYIVANFQAKEPRIMQNLQEKIDLNTKRTNNIYELREVCMKINRPYKNLYGKIKQKLSDLDLIETKYTKLFYVYNSIPQHNEISKLYTKVQRHRNNLAHVNVEQKLDDIKNDIKALISSYRSLIIDEKLKR